MDSKDEIICRCQEVTRGEIERAIEMGATTMNELKRFTMRVWDCAKDVLAGGW